MKATLLNVSKVWGVSKKTGNEYEMWQAAMIVPLEQVRSASYNVHGYGLDVQTIGIDSAILEQFAGMKFPAEVDLETDVRPQFGRMETFVTGIRRPAVKAA